MARPVKSRTIQSMPNCEGFIPVGYDDTRENQRVIMTIDEYETIRLIDYSNATQEDCAESMGISRSTVTNIYDSARKKLADALINEKILLIEGGNYNIIQQNCKTGGLKNKEKNLTLAVTYNDGEIFQHFGHCECFKIYTITDGVITASEIVNASGYGHGALVSFLKEHNVSVLICGGIGAVAKEILSKEKILFFPGVTGKADAAVEHLLTNTLVYNSRVQCEHHKSSCDFKD